MTENEKKTIFRAAYRGDIEYFRDYFQQPNSKFNVQMFRHPKSGDTVQHFAVRHGQLALLYFLKAQGFNMEITNFDGKCLLHEAAQNSQQGCLEFLLKCQVKVDILKRADWTPLMLACTKANVPVVQTLLQHGADPTLRNKDGWNSFHIAVREGHLPVVECLLQRDPALWDTVSRNGRTPLHTAVLHGHSDVVRHILDHCGYTADMADCCGTTPLMDALRVGDVTSADLLIAKHQADVLREDRLGRQSLHVSAEAGCLESVRYLVDACGVDPSTVSTVTEASALHLAAKEGQSAAVSLLLSLGVDADLQDHKQRTALHIAAGSQHASCVDALLQHGARQTPDGMGTRPHQLARTMEVVQLFKRFENT